MDSQVVPTGYGCDAPLFWGRRADGRVTMARKSWVDGDWEESVTIPHAVVLVGGVLSPFDAAMRADHDHGWRCMV